MSTDVANVSDSGLLLENAVAIGERWSLMIVHHERHAEYYWIFNIHYQQIVVKSTICIPDTMWKELAGLREVMQAISEQPF